MVNNHSAYNVYDEEYLRPVPCILLLWEWKRERKRKKERVSEKDTVTERASGVGVMGGV